MTTATIKVDGMMCSHCEARVNKAVTALEGVTSCKANAGNKEAVIDFDETIVSIARIKESIDDAGYDVID